MNKLILDCREVTVRYGAVTALDRATFRVDHGESVAIMGPSGSGKSTLLACIAGLELPTDGELTVLGRSLRGSRASQRASMRRLSMGMIFQEPELLPEFSTVENVAFSLLFDGVPRERALAQAVEALDSVGLADRAQAETATLSGGEAQRVAVARALVRPDVRLVIADEPTASLDMENATLVAQVLLDFARARGAATLLATHDPRIADMCDRVVRLERHAG